MKYNVLPYFPSEKKLNWFKFKGFADDKLILVQMVSFVFDRIENILGKGENAGIQHFLLFPKCFQKASSPGLYQNTGLFGKGMTFYQKMNFRLFQSDQNNNERRKQKGVWCILLNKSSHLLRIIRVSWGPKGVLIYYEYDL